MRKRGELVLSAEYTPYRICTCSELLSNYGCRYSTSYEVADLISFDARKSIRCAIRSSLTVLSMRDQLEMPRIHARRIIAGNVIRFESVRNFSSEVSVRPASCHRFLATADNSVASVVVRTVTGSSTTLPRPALSRFLTRRIEVEALNHRTVLGRTLRKQLFAIRTKCTIASSSVNRNELSAVAEAVVRHNLSVSHPFIFGKEVV